MGYHTYDTQYIRALQGDFRGAGYPVFNYHRNIAVKKVENGK